MATYLDALMMRARERSARDSRDFRQRLETSSMGEPCFAAALRDSINVAVIAEVKKKSPSKGWLNQTMNVAHIAHEYEIAGATAISVLTEFEGFGGSLDDLRLIDHTVSMPLLRKDFTVSVNDVIDGYESGANAILLIVAALSDDELLLFSQVASHLGMDSLFEVHEAAEVERALASGASIIGVNQRDLTTFQVDTDRAERVVTAIPESVVRVCESGLRTPADVQRAADAGFDAVLVGESFVTSASPREACAAFTKTPKASR
jgi:indole-3-glycerol phosphate synthase